MNFYTGSAAHESFYHLVHPLQPGYACQGLACFATRMDAPTRWQEARSRKPIIHCLGQCYDGPAIHGDRAPCNIAVDSPHPVLLTNLISGGVRSFNDYQRVGGGCALAKALQLPADEIIEQVLASGLRGRGGAGFRAGRKWQTAYQCKTSPKYLVVNADEGDPGAFSDRILMEGDPFRLIEACLIAAITIGSEQGYIYLRREYPQTAAILQGAINAAYTHGWLGAHIAGSKHRFDLRLVMGKGSYVCGEETALLNAIEGLRPEVRIRPPQPAECGLFGLPTLVHNVETLCAVPWILHNGASKYSQMGHHQSRGTKLVSLNSVFQRPGLYEVEFGVSLKHIVENLGGGIKGNALKGVMIGGPLAGLIPTTLLETPFDYESLQSIGGAVGHGGIIAFRDDTSIPQIIAEVFRFGTSESCGKCTPCRGGSAEIARMFTSVLDGRRINGQRWVALVDALKYTSLCGHGRGLAEFARSIELHYSEELTQCFI